MSRNPFKPGDKIVRTGPSYPSEGMIQGQAYTVDRVSFRHISVVEITRPQPDYSYTAFAPVGA